MTYEAMWEEMRRCTAKRGIRRHKNGIPKKTEGSNIEASIEHKEKE